ncbi:MAG: hypothetical protein ACTSRZ_20265, partial [Promethearchaeota archaeon]
LRLMNSNQGELKLKFEERRVEGFEDWLSRIDLINDPSFIKLANFTFNNLLYCHIKTYKKIIIIKSFLSKI